jgi:hypothetical protein
LTPAALRAICDRYGAVKAMAADATAELEKLRRRFILARVDEAEGKLFRLVLSAETVPTTLDRAALERDLGAGLDRYLKFGKPSRSLRCYSRTGK